jgi:hypothetical protein
LIEMSDGQAPTGPVVLVHLVDPPGSGLAACVGLPIPPDTVAHRYPRLLCPGCVALGLRDGRSFADGQADGWRQLRAVLTGAALSWRTADGRRALAELLDTLPSGPQS